MEPKKLTLAEIDEMIFHTMDVRGVQAILLAALISSNYRGYVSEHAMGAHRISPSAVHSKGIIDSLMLLSEQTGRPLIVLSAVPHEISRGDFKRARNICYHIPHLNKLAKLHTKLVLRGIVHEDPSEPVMVILRETAMDYLRYKMVTFFGYYRKVQNQATIKYIENLEAMNHEWLFELVNQYGLAVAYRVIDKMEARLTMEDRTSVDIMQLAMDLPGMLMSIDPEQFRGKRMHRNHDYEPHAFKIIREDIVMQGMKIYTMNQEAIRKVLVR